MKCRHCDATRFIPFANLVNSPPSNSMLSEAGLNEPEVYYPLNVEVCAECYLVQVDEYKSAEEIFNSDYTYFSSFSSSWLAHCETFAKKAIERFSLDASSKVIEVASNDGYLLQFFSQRGVPVLGVEPTANTAEVARSKGVETIIEFFGEELARDRLAAQADLICGNNVYAHVPDINDFTAGLKAALKPDGVISLEFPHLLRLIEETQFDTIYHEHFSYLSLHAVSRIMKAQGLCIFDVEQLSTHGGSLRVFACHDACEKHPIQTSVATLHELEKSAGLLDSKVYSGFQDRVDRVRDDFTNFLIEQKRAGKKVAGYGAAAKGNTLLNYCGVKGTDLISFVTDLSPHKQEKFLPGSHIPVMAPEQIDIEKPDYIVIFPWNLRTEIMSQLQHVREWDAKFVMAVPELTIV